MLPPTLSLLLLLLTVRCTGAQQSPPNSFDDGDNFNGYGSNFSATTAVLIVAIVSGFFFLAFFSVYLRRCPLNRSAAVAPAATAGAVTASRRGDRRGLDPAVIEAFPTLTYSAATGLKIGKETLECAVCLSEFRGEEMLRMLPRCSHVFHAECIDTWLEGHVTCPVCRDNLSDVPADDGGGPNGGGEGESDACDDMAVDLRRMGRSHTVGHDMSGGDRYTLRLPEHVRREMVAAGSLRRSASVAVVLGGGEGSSRRGFRGAGGRSSWMGLSDRWTGRILARVASWRRGDADCSVKATGENSTKAGMIDCVGGAERGESSSNVGDSDKSAIAVLDRV